MYPKIRCFYILCIWSISGDFDAEKFKQNIRSAIDVYIERVNGTPAMGGKLMLFKGCEDSSLIARRPLLLKYLRGTKATKEKLKKSHSTLYRYFESITTILRDHAVVSHLPPKYALILRCCYKGSCIHPICRSTTNAPTPITWSQCPAKPPAPQAPPASSSCPCKQVLPISKKKSSYFSLVLSPGSHS